MDSFPFGHRPLNQFARRVTRCLTTTSRTNIGNPRLDPAQDHELCLPVGSAPTPRHRPLWTRFFVKSNLNGLPARSLRIFDASLAVDPSAVRSAAPQIFIQVSAVRRASFHVPPCSSSSCGPAAHSAPLRKFLFHFWVSRDPDYSWIMCFIGVVAAAEARSVDAANLVQLVRRPWLVDVHLQYSPIPPPFQPIILKHAHRRRYAPPQKIHSIFGLPAGGITELYILPFNLCVVLFTVPSPPARSSSPNPIRFFAFRRARLQGQFLPEPRQLKLQFSLSRERGYAFKFFPCGDLNVASTPTLAYSNHTAMAQKHTDASISPKRRAKRSISTRQIQLSSIATPKRGFQPHSGDFFLQVNTFLFLGALTLYT
ncbi:hypothetical protein C8R43DRAFT_1236676 [Mycena crocata]|nr:hypothetical protein C8R43DRAFT_1236676 [Mycena crocata]